MQVKVIEKEKDVIKDVKDEKGIQIDEGLLYQYIRVRRASTRAGLASTKGRSDVRGGGAKPYKQKGTGRARRGTSRSPLIVGGGVIFGPSPRDYSIKLNKKLYKKVKKEIYKYILKNSKVINLNLDEVSTKGAIKELELKNKESYVLLISNDNIVLEKSIRNVKFVNLYNINNFNDEKLLLSKNILITKQVKEIVEDKLK